MRREDFGRLNGRQKGKESITWPHPLAVDVEDVMRQRPKNAAVTDGHPHGTEATQGEPYYPDAFNLLFPWGAWLLRCEDCDCMPRRHQPTREPPHHLLGPADAGVKAVADLQDFHGRTSFYGGKYFCTEASMRILNIASGVWSMGAGRGMPSLFNVQREFVRAGHEVVILVPRPPWESPGKEGEIAEGITIRYVEVPLWQAGLPAAFVHTRLRRFLFFHLKWLLFVLALWRAAARAARAFKPDVVYGHDPHGIPVAYLLARRLGRPNVSRFYGTILYPFLRRRDIGRLVGHFDDILAFLTPANLYVVTNDGTRGEEVARILGVDSRRLHFPMNGVDFELGEPSADRGSILRRLGLLPSAPVTLSVNRLDWWKRIDRLIAAAAELRISVPAAQILIVGDGPERPGLEDEVRTRGLADTVHLLGSVDRPTVRGLLHACDLFVGVSDLSNLGNNLLEAMMAGCAIVATDAGDTGRVVIHGETGYLLPEQRLADLGGVMASLLQDKAARERLGQGARAFAKAHFSTWVQRGQWEVEIVEDLLRSLRGGHG